MMGFLTVIAVLCGLGALGGLPAVGASLVSLKAGWVVLVVTAILPLILAYSNSVNPAFGGWIVLAGPYWSGSIIAFGFLVVKTYRARLTHAKGL